MDAVASDVAGGLHVGKGRVESCVVNQIKTRDGEVVRYKGGGTGKVHVLRLVRALGLNAGCVVWFGVKGEASV